MNVVLEGPDGSGKSTLAAHLGAALGMHVQQGSGPPKAPGEVEARLTRYLALDNTIFDRHPAVSQVVYGSLRGETPSAEFLALVDKFYSSELLFVYCRATDLKLHVVKDGENPDHIATIERRHADLLAAYDRWALEKAHIVYRIGDDTSAILDVVRVIAC